MDIRDNRAARRSGTRMIPALLVIGLGVVFLLRNLGIDIGFLDQPRWWAWLILITAIGPLVDAMQRFHSRGAMDARVWRSLFSAALIVLIALMFLLHLRWQQWWPVFVIYGGLCMLVRDPRDSTAN